MKKEEKTKAEQDMKELTEDELAGAAGGSGTGRVKFLPPDEMEELDEHTVRGGVWT